MAGQRGLGLGSYRSGSGLDGRGSYRSRLGSGSGLGRGLDGRGSNRSRHGRGSNRSGSLLALLGRFGERKGLPGPVHNLEQGRQGQFAALSVADITERAALDALQLFLAELDVDDGDLDRPDLGLVERERAKGGERLQPLLGRALEPTLAGLRAEERDRVRLGDPTRLEERFVSLRDRVKDQLRETLRGLAEDCDFGRSQGGLRGPFGSLRSGRSGVGRGGVGWRGVVASSPSQGFLS